MSARPTQMRHGYHHTVVQEGGNYYIYSTRGIRVGGPYADFIDALQWACDNLDAGRSYVQWVLCKGDIMSCTQQLDITTYDFTGIRVMGKLYTANATNTEIFASDGVSQVEEFHLDIDSIDGNIANNPTIDKSFVWFHYMKDSSCIIRYGKDVNGHLIRSNDNLSCYFKANGENIWDAVLSLVNSENCVFDIQGRDNDEDAVVWILDGSRKNIGNIVAMNPVGSALKLDGTNATTARVEGNTVFVSTDGGSVAGVEIDTYSYNNTVVFSAIGDDHALAIGLVVRTNTQGNLLMGTIKNTTGVGAQITGDDNKYVLTVIDAGNDAVAVVGDDNDISVFVDNATNTGIEITGDYNKIRGKVQNCVGVGEWGVRDAGTYNEIDVAIRNCTNLMTNPLPTGSHVITKMKTGEYTGDAAATLAVTGVGFEVRDLEIYAQSDGLTDNFGRKTNQDGTMALYSIANAAWQYEADHIISLDADGFTVGDGTGGTGGNVFNIGSQVYTYVARG